MVRSITLPIVAFIIPLTTSAVDCIDVAGFGVTQTSDPPTEMIRSPQDANGNVSCSYREKGGGEGPAHLTMSFNWRVTDGDGIDSPMCARFEPTAEASLRTRWRGRALSLYGTKRVFWGTVWFAADFSDAQQAIWVDRATTMAQALLPQAMSCEGDEAVATKGEGTTPPGSEDPDQPSDADVADLLKQLEEAGDDNPD